MGIHQCPLIVRSCKWLDINSFIRTLHDVLRYFGTHWHQWWDCLTLVNDIPLMVGNPMTSFHVRHRHIYSHGKNCTIGFCSYWRLYILHDSINSFTATYFQPYETTTILLLSLIFYVIQPSNSLDPLLHILWSSSSSHIPFAYFINFLGNWRYVVF